MNPNITLQSVAPGVRSKSLRFFVLFFFVVAVFWFFALVTGAADALAAVEVEVEVDVVAALACAFATGVALDALAAFAAGTGATLPCPLV